MIRRMYLLMLIFMSELVMAGSTSGTTSGVGGAGRTAAQRAVGEIASYIYTLAIVIFIVSVFVGLTIGAWNTMKHIKQQNVDIAEIIMLWCQILAIITMMFGASKIASKISKMGSEVERVEVVRVEDNRNDYKNTIGGK